MKKYLLFPIQNLSSFSKITTSTLVVAALVAFAATPAFAAKPVATPSGNDISWPQCGGSFPSGQAFAIVGVNGGLANDASSCLGPYPSNAGSELYWAATTSLGGTKQPLAQLYVNTGDPGTTVADWPTTSLSADPYGNCDASNSVACAWQYGYNMAAQDATDLTNAATALKSSVSTLPSAYYWWFDVETGNTWQSSSTTTGQAMNTADLQGMFYDLNTVNSVSNVGVYSTSFQWGQIVGKTSLGSLGGLSNWIPGARSQNGAKSNCSLPSFTGGTVTMTQWFAHPYDADYSCIG